MKTKTVFYSVSMIFIVAVVLNVAVDQQASAQQPRFGFVNSTTIMTQFEDAQRAQRQVENLFSGWENQLMEMYQELQDTYEDFQRRQGMMTEQARVEEQQRLVEMEQEINRFQREKFGQGGEGVREQERIFRPVREKIMSAIEDVARQENLNFVFEKTADFTVLLYADSRYDITFKVLDHLKRGGQ